MRPSPPPVIYTTANNNFRDALEFFFQLQAKGVQRELCGVLKGGTLLQQGFDQSDALIKAAPLLGGFLYMAARAQRLLSLALQQMAQSSWPALMSRYVV